jgi:hypothetical protein
MKQNYRGFLLGMSDEDAERCIEEGILDGSVDPDHLRMAEDELIDDYHFGKLSEDEQRSFDSHFLSSPERRAKQAFARSLTDYANSRAVWEKASGQQSSRKAFWSLGWRTPAIAAIAATLVLAILLGFQEARLRHKVQEAQNSRSEADRLRSALSEENHRLPHQALPANANPSTGTAKGTATGSSEASGTQSAALDLAPGLTRGVQRQVMLRLSDRAFVVWINLELPSALSGKVREELIGADGERIWMQEFTAIAASSMSKSTIALPVSLLAPGDYQIKVEQQNSSGVFEKVGTYAFHVARS